MKRRLPAIRLQIAGMLAALLAVSGCGLDETSRDDIPPAAPLVVPRSPGNAAAQRGIRAEPTSSDVQYRVRLEWYPNTESDVVGYRVWRRREDDPSREWRIVRDLRYGTNLDPGPILWFVDPGDDWLGFPRDLLRPDQPDDSISSRGFWWRIQAYDEANNRSPYSDSMYFRMVNNPRNLRVVREAPRRYRMHWQFAPNNDPEGMSYYFMTRVFESQGGPDSLVWLRQWNHYGDTGSWELNDDGRARGFVEDEFYTWQLDVVVMATDTSSRVPAGASAYTTFQYKN